MSFSDKPRAPRRARPRQSLKMQAIGFLSRREHSRQELRSKLLDSLRKRAREDAALAAAAQAGEHELARAIAEQPSNGIDDAFAPPGPTPTPGSASARTPDRFTRVAPARRTPVNSRGQGREATAACASGGVLNPPAAPSSAAATRAALVTLTRGDGSALPPGLRSRLEAVAGKDVDKRASASASLSASASASGSASAPQAAALAGVHDAGIDTNDLGIGQAQAFATPRSSDDPEGSSAEALERTDPEAAVDQLLDWLVAHQYLSETRFVESRVNARSRKQGTLRIKIELSRHGLQLEPEQAAALRESEFARAQALWQRKFGVVATDARERAKQGRFLASRGFAADVVRRIVGGQQDD